MESRLYEFIYVVGKSMATQVFLLLAIVLPLGFLIAGPYIAEGLTFHGPLAQLTETFRGLIVDRYDKGAMTAFLLMMGGAITSYRKAHRRVMR